ncbi:AraC family transcriptional regulator [Hydrocarboniclastica marina]|uniref:AraC family transcriptional regulator n=1 Tax=Hydrocarboniclastica marina TaxID=2259620 RepID=A0A4P7XKT0_9ALTE|nr:AraC family transcriptional regulator [Hydrocarboniclastica marina]MAL97103.1 AraC family transcriptional regulator [Alteromonadaceae bacterium]QCF27846.1 AraC family transcriptional regulator [Hydrocarboniclastica marina]
MGQTNRPIFWRDPRMPYVELRKVEDGRQVCYAPHTHVQWSMGAITGGQSTFLYGDSAYQVAAGSLVLINPERVHACNPIDGQPWAYFMLYVDRHWLARLLFQAGLFGAPHWRDMPYDVVESPRYFADFCAMAEFLMSRTADIVAKEHRLRNFLIDFLTGQAGTSAQWPVAEELPERLAAVADHLDAHCTDHLALEELSAWAGYSPSYFIRAFKTHFGLTPHAYQINRRVQRGQQNLKQGVSVAEAALESGFSDQPHFQRLFKRLVAATPGDYTRVQQPSASQTRETGNWPPAEALTPGSNSEGSPGC